VSLPADDETSTIGTQVPTRTPPPPVAPSTAHSSMTVGSPLEALERDEMARTRRFCFIGIAIALIAATSVPLLPGNATAAGMVIVAMAFLLTRSSDPIKFRAKTTLLGWFVPAVCVTTAIPFFGVFSPAPLILVLGIYFTALGKSRALAIAVYVVCAGAQAVVSVLVIAGSLPETGMINAAGMSRPHQLLIQALVQFVLGATFVTGRMSRKTALAAVGELERAVRVAAHREALLLEAREELERALRSGRGRFTDQTIGGYKLGTVLGRGAMGEVYAATDSQGHTVAIKLLSQTSLANATHVRRFFRELRTAAGLDAPNIVRVIEVGEAPVPYLVMERLEGKTLAEILKGKRALRAEEVVDLVRQIGAGITAAAAKGIVHRDLKPQNIFQHGEAWKILDFGVSRAAEHGDTLTSGGVVGTPSYMAPEQASGGSVDHCTDLYALAAVAYRSMTGHPPFAAGEIAETLYRVVHTKPRRPSELADLPPDVDLVMAIGLAKRPEHRFSSAVELAEALADAFTETLSSTIRDRGGVLERNGAWMVQPTSRSSTHQIRRRT